MLPVIIYKMSSSRFAILYNYCTENFFLAQFFFFHQIEICPLAAFRLSEMQKATAENMHTTFFLHCSCVSIAPELSWVNLFLVVFCWFNACAHIVKFPAAVWAAIFLFGPDLQRFLLYQGAWRLSCICMRIVLVAGGCIKPLFGGQWKGGWHPRRNYGESRHKWRWYKWPTSRCKDDV